MVILFFSNLLIYPVICESSKYNRLITLLSLYPRKYLNELYSPYYSFLGTNILLTSISSIFIIFFVFVVEITFLDIFIVKIYALSVHSYIL